jgi:hypothetical protein
MRLKTKLRRFGRLTGALPDQYVCSCELELTLRRLFAKFCWYPMICSVFMLTSRASATWSAYDAQVLLSPGTYDDQPQLRDRLWCGV